MATLYESLQDREKILYTDAEGMEVFVYDKNDQEQIKIADSLGYKKLNAAQLRDLYNKEKEKEKFSAPLGQTTAGVAGISRGLTFGLSDFLLSAQEGLARATHSILTDRSTPGTFKNKEFNTKVSESFLEGYDAKSDELEKLQQYNPKTSIAGEIVGAVAPAIISGGAAAPVSGAKIGLTAARLGVRSAARATGPGLASALGRAVERGIANEFSHTGVKIAAKIAGGAAEALPYGLPISAMALDDDADLSAEAIASNVGLSALIGGGIGGVAGVAGAALPAITKAIWSEKAAEEVLEQGLNSTDGMITGWLKRRYTSLAAWRSGLDKKEISGILQNLDIPESELSSALYGAREGEILGAQQLTELRKIKQNVSLISKETRDTMIKNHTDFINEALQRNRQLIKRLKFSPNNIPDEVINYYRKTEDLVDSFGKKSKYTGNKIVPKKVQQYLDNAHDVVQSERAMRYNAWHQAEKQLHVYLSSNKNLGFADAAEASFASADRVTLNRVIEAHNLYRHAEKYAQKERTLLGTGLPTLVAAGGGFGLAGGPAGLLAAAPAYTILRAGKNPAFEISALNKGIFASKQLTHKVVTAVDGLVKSPRTPLKVASVATYNAVSNESLEPRVDMSLQRWQDEISLLSTNPSIFADRLNASTVSLAEQFPKTAAKLHEKSAAAVAFLQSKAINLTANNPMLPNAQRKPNDSEIRKFERYFAYTMNPQTYLDEIAQGIVNPEGAETLKAVYPALHEQLIRELHARLYDPEKPLSLQARAKIIKIIGLQQTNAGAIQGIYSPAKEQAAQQERRKLSDRAVTRGMETEQTSGQHLINK